MSDQDKILEELAWIRRLLERIYNELSGLRRIVLVVGALVVAIAVLAALALP